MKCSRVGCPREATQHNQVPIGDGMVADAWFCDEHFKEGMKSLGVNV